MTLDLDRYCKRIGYSGPGEASLSVLQELHRLHPMAIPFESIDPWLARPVHLDISSIEEKLVRSNRGGYCYEQNTLFTAVLRMLGFKTSGMAGRVLYRSMPDGSEHPRSHMATLVHLREGDFIADVGFGGLTLTAPVKLTVGDIQKTPHERVRLLHIGGNYLLEAEVESEWRPLYEFGLEEHSQADYIMGNWFYSTYPGSPFVQRLVVVRACLDRRLVLLNTQLSVYFLNGTIEKRALTSVEEIVHVLVNDFALSLPKDERLAPRLQQLLAPAN